MVKHRNKLLIVTIIVVIILFGAIVAVIESQGLVSGSWQITLPEGDYYLTVSAGWNGVEDFSNAFHVRIG